MKMPLYKCTSPTLLSSLFYSHPTFFLPCIPHSHIPLPPTLFLPSSPFLLPLPFPPNEFLNRKPKTSHMFFKYNTALGPPFHILMDTNFINFCIQNKMDIMQSMMDTLYGKCMLPKKKESKGEIGLGSKGKGRESK